MELQGGNSVAELPVCRCLSAAFEIGSWGDLNEFLSAWIDCMGGVEPISLKAYRITSGRPIDEDVTRRLGYWV